MATQNTILSLGKLPGSKVKAIIMADGKIYPVDKKALAVIPQADEEEMLNAEEILALIEEGESLNQKTETHCGKHYYATEKLLEEYLFYTMNFNAGIEADKEINAARAQILENIKEPQHFTAYDQTDLHSINYMVLQSRSATKRMAKYFSREDNFERAAAAARLVDSGIKALKESGVKEWSQEADILICCYMTPENVGLGEDKIMEFLDLKKTTYFKMKKSAISHLSRFMFGSFPNERGYLDDEESDDEKLLYEYFFPEKTKAKKGKK